MTFNRTYYSYRMKNLLRFPGWFYPPTVFLQMSSLAIWIEWVHRISWMKCSRKKKREKKGRVHLGLNRAMFLCPQGWRMRKCRVLSLLRLKMRWSHESVLSSSPRPSNRKRNPHTQTHTRRDVKGTVWAKAVQADRRNRSLQSASHKHDSANRRPLVV